MEEIVKETLKPYLNEIYNTCMIAFEEAKTDRFWASLDARYRSTRISSITTLYLEELFKKIGISTSRSHNSFRFSINNVVGRFKKLNKYTKMPQNVQTFRNNHFIKGQLQIAFDKLNEVFPITASTIPITIGYFIDDFFSKILSVEIVCQSQNFRFEIEKPQNVVNIIDRIPEPTRNAKISASKKAKKERLNNGKQQINAEDKL